MIELTCTEVREAAAEFALDILEPAERSALAAHLIRCPACREEVDAMVAVGAQLLELVPGTEPPLGFDRRVLARVKDLDPEHGRSRRPSVHPSRRFGARRPRLFAAVAAAAAAVALVFGSLGWFAGRTTNNPHNQVVLTAAFRQGTRHVGEVYAYSGSPPWLTMTIHAAAGSEKVTCELVGTDGIVTRIGSFDLVGGSGSWGAPDRAGFAGVSGARLIGSDGRVIATATFRA